MLVTTSKYLSDFLSSTFNRWDQIPKQLVKLGSDLNFVNHFVFEIRYAIPLTPPRKVREPEIFFLKTRSVEPHVGHGAPSWISDAPKDAPQDLHRNVSISMIRVVKANVELTSAARLYRARPATEGSEVERHVIRHHSSNALVLRQQVPLDALWGRPIHRIAPISCTAR